MPSLAHVKLRLLMVTHAPQDAALVKHALHHSAVGESFRAVSDTTEALAYLRGDEEFSDRSRYPFPNALLIQTQHSSEPILPLLSWVQAHGAAAGFLAVFLFSPALKADLLANHPEFQIAPSPGPTVRADFLELLDRHVVAWPVSPGLGLKEQPDPPRQKTSLGLSPNH